MKRLLGIVVCALGALLWLGAASAQAQLTLSPERPSNGQVFQAGNEIRFPNQAFIQFHVRVSGPYLAGPVRAVISRDPSSLQGQSTAGKWTPMECRLRGEPDVFAVCPSEILGWIGPGTHYWRPWLSGGVFGTSSDFKFGTFWGPMRSFTVLPYSAPPRPTSLSLRMSLSQAIRYAKIITRGEVGAKAWRVVCRRTSSSRFVCGTASRRGRKLYSLRFSVWHRKSGGSVFPTYRIIRKKRTS
jgi:hypothetical protein